MSDRCNWSGIIALACTLVALPALADDSHRTSEHHVSGLRFDAHGIFGGYGSLGAGLRVDIPIIERGLLASADDELALSPGLDVFFADFYPDYYDGGPYFVPSAVLQWNFYIERWSVFPEVGLAFYVGSGRNDLRHDRSVYVVPALGIGARYHFSSRNALLARLSTPTGLQLGLTF